MVAGSAVLPCDSDCERLSTVVSIVADDAISRRDSAMPCSDNGAEMICIQESKLLGIKSQLQE
jgi:hypothetical protein